LALLNVWAHPSLVPIEGALDGVLFGYRSCAVMEWMDVQKPALEALLADRDVPAFRTVLDSFEPDVYDMDLNELFETGLRYLLDGFQRAK
jgi:hypothetical protein